MEHSPVCGALSDKPHPYTLVLRVTECVFRRYSATKRDTRCLILEHSPVFGALPDKPHPYTLVPRVTVCVFWRHSATKRDARTDNDTLTGLYCREN